MAKHILLKVHELIVSFLQSIYHIINTLYFDIYIYKSNLRNNAIGGLVRMDLSYLCNLRECRISTVATVNCGLFYMVKIILIKDITSLVQNILFSTLCILFLSNWIWYKKMANFYQYIGPMFNIIKIFILFCIHIVDSIKTIFFASTVELRFYSHSKN